MFQFKLSYRLFSCCLMTWSLRPQGFSWFWNGHSDLFMFLNWSLRPFHVFQFATQTYSCFWHGHSDLFKIWHGHSDLFLFMAWSLRPSYVFDLVNQTYSCFWHGHSDLSMFLTGWLIPFHGFDMITQTFSCFSLVFQPFQFLPKNILRKPSWSHFFNYHVFKWKCSRHFYLRSIPSGFRFYPGSTHTSIFSVELAFSLRTRNLWLLVQSEKQRHAPPEVHLPPWVKRGVEAQAANLRAVWTGTDAGQVHEEASVDQILCESAWLEKKRTSDHHVQVQ